MRHFMLALIFAALGIGAAPAVAQISTPEQQGEEARYKEYLITTEVDYDGGVFGGGKQKVIIEGVLILPDPEKWKAPHPLAVINHGSQPWGPSPRNFVAFDSDKPNQRHVTYFFALRGFAVYFPIRKGFGRNEGPVSKASLRISEPVDDCKNASESITGFDSAKSDVKALLAALKRTRDYINMNKIVMTGLSRGGMVSLGRAYDDYPGIVGVISWVGGWHTEFCSDGTNFNRPWFQKFGEKLRLPILSVYGDKDELIPVGAVRERLEFLEKNNPRARTLMLPGQGHYSPIRIGNWFQSGRLFMRQFLE